MLHVQACIAMAVCMYVEVILDTSLCKAFASQCPSILDITTARSDDIPGALGHRVLTAGMVSVLANKFWDNAPNNFQSVVYDAGHRPAHRS